MSHPHATAHAPYAASSSEDIPWLFLDPRAYHRLGLVTIRHSGVTTRANHVIVSPYGIFVIEENSDAGSFQASPGINWTQYRDEQSLEIPNPVRQVSHEVHALQEALEMPSSHFHGAVFFTSGQAYLKGEVPDNVISENFTDYIKSFKKVILSDAEVNAIVTQLTQQKIPAKPAQAQQVHHRPPERHAQPKAVTHRPAPPAPAAGPNRMKSLAFGLAALLLGALVTSAIFLWLS